MHFCLLCVCAIAHVMESNKEKAAEVAVVRTLGGAITKEEFYSVCKQRGFIGNKGPAPNFTSMDGSNSMGHNGNFHVPPTQNMEFLRLVARALLGGVPLCISACVKPTPDHDTFNFFIDVDAKKMLSRTTTEEEMTDVANAIFRLAEPILGDEPWSRQMMSKEKLPRLMLERWPSFSSVNDVLSSFASNPFTIAEVSQTDGNRYTLADLFTTDVAAQNWFGAVFATAVAHHTQRVVRTFFPSISATHSTFDVYAMSSVNNTVEPSAKVGAHIHMPNMVVNIERVSPMVAAIQNALVKVAGLILDKTVDEAPYDPNNVTLRLPFNWKAQSIAKMSKESASGNDSDAKRLRYIGPVSGKSILYNRMYICAAVLLAKKGQVDLARTNSIQHDPYSALLVAQIRTSPKTKVTDGFSLEKVDMSTTYSPATIMLSLRGAGYSEKEARAKKEELERISDPEEQQNRLNAYVAEAIIRKKKRIVRKNPEASPYITLPPDHKIVVDLKKRFPDLLERTFRKQLPGSVRTIGVFTGFAVGVVKYDRANCRFTIYPTHSQRVPCFNRSVNGSSCQPHNFKSTVYFVMDNMHITQKCWNSNESQNRCEGVCSKWKGKAVDIAQAMRNNLDPASRSKPSVLSDINNIVEKVIPTLLKWAAEECASELPDHNEEVQKAIGPAAAAAAKPALKRAASYSFSGAAHITPPASREATRDAFEEQEEQEQEDEQDYNQNDFFS